MKQRLTRIDDILYVYDPFFEDEGITENIQLIKRQLGYEADITPISVHDYEKKAGHITPRGILLSSHDYKTLTKGDKKDLEARCSNLGVDFKIVETEVGFLRKCYNGYTNALNSNEWGEVKKARKGLEDSFARISILTTPSSERMENYGSSTSLFFTFGFKDRERIGDIRDLEKLRERYEKAKKRRREGRIIKFERILKGHNQKFIEKHGEYNNLLAGYLKKQRILPEFYYFCSSTVRSYPNQRPSTLQVSEFPELEVDLLDHLGSLSFDRHLFSEGDDIKKFSSNEGYISRCGFCNNQIPEENKLIVPELGFIPPTAVFVPTATIRPHHDLCGKEACLINYIGYSLYWEKINSWVNRARTDLERAVYSKILKREITEGQLPWAREEAKKLALSKIEQLGYKGDQTKQE